jgi:hypothetical protein
VSEPGGRIVRAAALLLLAGALGGVAAVMADAPTARESLLRYTFAAVAVLAVAPIHVLLPDQAVPWLQRLNPPPGGLLRRALGRWAGVVAATLAPVLGLAIYRGGGVSALEAALVIIGLGALAFERTMILGPLSQAWQEGTRGELYRRLIARDARASLQVPHGMVPGTLSSAVLFAVGAGAILATVAAAAASSALGWVPGGVLAGWGGVRLARLAPGFDRAFYHTSGLYEELLRGGGVRAGRAALGYEAVYWVPRRWRPHAWAGLLQLDRRLPLGRLVALGVLGLWGVLVWGVSEAAVVGYIAVGLLARNATILLHAAPHLSPAARHLAFQSVSDWAATRFWINARWVLATAGALGVAALFSARIGWGHVAAGVGLDLLLAALTALAATYTTEHRLRRRYA